MPCGVSLAEVKSSECEEYEYFYMVLNFHLPVILTFENLFKYYLFINHVTTNFSVHWLRCNCFEKLKKCINEHLEFSSHNSMY